MEPEHCQELFPPESGLRLYFSDTRLSYREISELLTRNIGPAGSDTWQNGAEQSAAGHRGYVEIYTQGAGVTLVAIAWGG